MKARSLQRSTQGKMLAQKCFFVKGDKMKYNGQSGLRDWLVPPVVLPIFFGLLILAVALFR